jgi:hypothetical protein
MICEITGIHEQIIKAKAGPLNILIPKQYINEENIVHYKTSYLPKNENGDIINEPIVENSYIKVKVIAKKIVNGKDFIFCLATLENVASDKEIDEYHKMMYHQYDENEEFIEYDKLSRTTITNKKEDSNTIEESEESDKSLYEDTDSIDSIDSDNDNNSEDEELSDFDI